jgi:hypothetical protein
VTEHIHDKMDELERERDEALARLDSEKSTRNAIIAQGVELEKQLEAMREVLRTIREESAKIFSATAGLPDCGLIHRVAAAAQDHRKDVSAWWMYDNHTFRKIDLTGDWRGDTLACFETDPYGSFFVRDTNDRTIFHLPGHGRGKREEFIAGLAAWSPQDAPAMPTASDERPII